MTDTDDTDELLLIPPDFFLTDSADNWGPYYNIVDSLITQVTELENRVNHIESSSELSFVSDSPIMNSPSRNKQYSSSSQSTPQKPRGKFTMHSLPNSPDLDRLKKAQKHKKNDFNPMLGEIDVFLSNVKAIKRMNAVRNIENDFGHVEGARNLDLNKVNELLKDLEVEEVKEKPMSREKVWQAGDTIGTVPDYGYGMRKNMYPESQKTYNLADSSIDKNDSESSSEDTQQTAFDKFSYKSRVAKPKRDEDYNGVNLGLVSLSKLWSSNDGKGLPSSFQQKLQEERLRRQHCEQAIQDLQNRILELQERVAVAIQVDEAKDKAILRFHDSWEKAGSKLQEIDKEKSLLEGEIEKLRKKLTDESGEANQKIAYYEKETSKALGLARFSQDKLSALEQQYSQLESDLKTVEINSEEFQMKYMAEVEKNRQYPEILAKKELELNECKVLLADARQEISQSKRAVDMCQSDLQSIKKENESLESKLESEKENSKKLIDQKNKLLEEVGAHKSIAKGLQDELIKAREQLETNKLELKNFYQGQVEIVVQSKLKEFQNQLDEAEKNLKNDLSKKELSIAKTAAGHIQQISEKHALEIKLLEEKHQEECRLYQVQISQLRDELEGANTKIKRQQDRQMNIEKHLHKFMESLRQDHVSHLDDMNSFRSKSFNNLEEILSFGSDDKDKIAETPVSSRNEKGAKRKESIQETIQMLLEKRGSGDDREVSREGSQFYQKMLRDMKGGKPPWK